MEIQRVISDIAMNQVKRKSLIVRSLCTAFLFLVCDAVHAQKKDTKAVQAVNSQQKQIVPDSGKDTNPVTGPIPKPEKKFTFSAVEVFDDILTIQKRGKLIVAMYYVDKPPFYFVDKEGNTIGNDPEIAEAIAKAIGPDVKVEYLRTAKTFDEIIQLVHEGKADIAISKLSYTMERAKRVIYSQEPYIELYAAFMINRSAPSALSLSELFAKKSGYKLCAIKGSSQVRVAQELFPNVDILGVETAEDTLKFLQEGKCIGSMRDNNEIRKILFDNPKLNLRYKSVILKDKKDPIFIVTDPKKPKLAYFIDLLLENTQSLKLSLDQIFAKYEDKLR
jgi:polar amino acid transport system substrate-binding protein